MPRAAPPPRRFLRRGAALAFVVALATLTACGGSADEGAGASGSSSGSPSESSSGSSSASAASSSASGGSDSASSSAPAGESHQITATEEDFSIALDSTDLAAGDYEIEVVNNGGATHDLVVEKDGEDVARSDHIAPGDSGSVSVSLEPGQYVFYCSIGAHRALGMEIEVTVT